MPKTSSGLVPVFIIIAALLFTYPQTHIPGLHAKDRAESLIQIKNASYGIFSFEQAKENLQRAYENILNIRYSGDVENDFSTIMIILEMGIGLLLEEEALGGRDTLMKMLASHTEKRYREMAELLKTYLGKEKAGIAAAGAGDDNLSAIMRDTLSAAIENLRGFRMGNNPDLNCALLLSVHYKVSKTASELYLIYGKDRVLEQIASRIKDDDIHSEQIIRKWLVRNSGDKKILTD